MTANTAASSRLRAFYSGAVRHDSVAATPFKKGTASVVEMFREAPRERRLAPDVSTETATERRQAKNDGCWRGGR
jgi:hypothetical protein